MIEDKESHHSKQPSLDLQRLKMLKALTVKRNERKSNRHSNISIDMLS